MLTIIETDQEGSASETEEGLGTIQEAEEYGQLQCCKIGPILLLIIKLNRQLTIDYKIDYVNF